MNLRKMSFGILAVIGLIGGLACLGLYLAMPDSVGGLAQFGLAAAHPLAAGVILDAVVAGIAFLIWMVPEARTLSMRRSWIYIVLFFTTPLAFVVPLFMWNRERKLEQRLKGATAGENA